MNGTRSDMHNTTTTNDPGPNGLDTAVEASSREEAALALVGLTTAALPPPGGIAASAATPRPPASSASRPTSASTSVVTPGSSASNKPRGKLTYIRGVGLVSGEISAELLATLVPQTPAAGKPAEQKDTDSKTTSPGMDAVSADANAVQTPRAPKKTTNKKKSPGRPRKQTLAADAAKSQQQQQKDTKKQEGSPTRKRNVKNCTVQDCPRQGRGAKFDDMCQRHWNASKKGTDNIVSDGDSSPSPATRPTYSRKKLVTADGKRKGDWDDDETARLQSGIQALGSNWKDIAEQYVQTRTKQQCKSKNQKMVRSDGEDWHTKTFLTLKKVRRPLSEPPTKRALKVDGMKEPVVRQATTPKKKQGRRDDVNDPMEDLPSLPPLPPAMPPALPPPQYEEKGEEDQIKASHALDSGVPPADTGGPKPPVPPPRPEGGDTSDRRLSKRRPKRTVAEIWDEFEAKQDMKQTMTRKKAKVQEAPTGATKKQASAHSKAARVTPDGTGDVSESVPTRPRSRSAAKTKEVVDEKRATVKRKKGSKKTVAAASAKKASTKAAAKSGKRYEYPRCTTPGCTRQRQGGCAGQCRKHFNADRLKAGLEGARTYAKTCKREGCNKLKQWGFGEYCRAHFAEELCQKGALCSVPICKKLPVRGCDGMCTVHYRKHKID